MSDCKTALVQMSTWPVFYKDRDIAITWKPKQSVIFIHSESVTGLKRKKSYDSGIREAQILAALVRKEML